MKLYRQKSLGSWNDVFNAMELKLSLKLKIIFLSGIKTAILKKIYRCDYEFKFGLW